MPIQPAATVIVDGVEAVSSSDSDSCDDPLAVSDVEPSSQGDTPGVSRGRPAFHSCDARNSARSNQTFSARGFLLSSAARDCPSVVRRVTSVPTLARADEKAELT